MEEQTVNDLQGEKVVLLPPCQTKTVYTVTCVFKVSNRPNSAEKVRLRHPETGSEQVQYARNVRIASKEERKIGQRIDPKDDFEQWFKFQPFYPKLVYIHGDRLFDFDASDNTYRTLPVNMTWILWQELQKKLEGHLFTMNAMAEVLHKQNCIIDDARDLVTEWKSDDFSQDKAARHVAYNCAGELDDVLKGNSLKDGAA